MFYHIPVFFKSIDLYVTRHGGWLGVPTEGSDPTPDSCERFNRIPPSPNLSLLQAQNSGMSRENGRNEAKWGVKRILLIFCMDEVAHVVGMSHVQALGNPGVACSGFIPEFSRDLHFPGRTFR